VGAAENRLLVSTQCPTCGAALDFGEGSNCVACAYCRSNLLVTGRRRLLSYAVTPRVEARDAFAIARFAEPTTAAPLRVGEPRRFFLPYYRFRAIELRWQRADPGPPPVELAPETTEQYRPAISIAQALADLAPNPDEVELHERHIELEVLEICRHQLFLPAPPGTISASPMDYDTRGVPYCPAVSLSTLVAKRFETEERTEPCLGPGANLDVGPECLCGDLRQHAGGLERIVHHRCFVSARRQ